MDDAEGRYERVMGGVYGDNAGLLSALAVLAPDGNVRVAVVNLIDFLADTEDTEPLVDKRVVLEILARGIIHLGWAIPGEETEYSSTEEHFEDMTELNASEAIAHFRRQLEMDDEDD